MYKKVVISFILFICYSNFLMAQQIEGVRSEVKDDKILVHFVINGGSLTDNFDISLYESSDGGKTFIGPLKEVKGDAGTGIRKGSRTIIWDALKEMPLLSDTMVFQVRAVKEHVKRKFFIIWEGNSVTWIGLRAGMLGKVGFYYEFRANPNAFLKSSFTYNNGVITDYYPEGYYTFSGKNGYSAVSAVAGINWQIIPDLYINAGAGFGKENYLVQIDQFEYGNSWTGSQAYAKYMGYCFSGLEIDAGLMYKLKWIIFSAGVTTISFNTYNWTAGIGVAF